MTHEGSPAGIIIDREPEEERRRSPLFMVIAIVGALAVAGGLLAGYFYLVSKNAEKMQAAKQTEPKAAPIELHIYEDDAMLKGGQATIAGTVHNISSSTFNDLSAVLELFHRKDSSIETRTINIEPKDLAPDAKGTYSITVASADYRIAKLKEIRSASRGDSIGFQTFPGAQRPPENGPAKTIIVNRPQGSGEGFINTPDNPTRIP